MSYTYVMGPKGVRRDKDGEEPRCVICTDILPPGQKRYCGRECRNRKRQLDREAAASERFAAAHPGLYKLKRRDKGFTLIEVMITVIWTIILVIFAMVGYYAYRHLR